MTLRLASLSVHIVNVGGRRRSRPGRPHVVVGLVDRRPDAWPGVVPGLSVGLTGRGGVQGQPPGRPAPRLAFAPAARRPAAPAPRLQVAGLHETVSGRPTPPNAADVATQAETAPLTGDSLGRRRPRLGDAAPVGVGRPRDGAAAGTGAFTRARRPRPARRDVIRVRVSRPGRGDARAVDAAPTQKPGTVCTEIILGTRPILATRVARPLTARPRRVVPHTP